MADPVVLQARLDEATAALHKLMTGTAEVRVNIGDKQVEYNRMEADKLKDYIASLTTELAGAVSVTGSTRRGLSVDL